MNLCSKLLLVSAIAGTPFAAKADSISVIINGTSYQCSGSANNPDNGRAATFCNCENSDAAGGDYALALFAVQGNSTKLIRVLKKYNTNPESSCRSDLQSHPACRP